MTTLDQSATTGPKFPKIEVREIRAGGSSSTLAFLVEHSLERDEGVAERAAFLREARGGWTYDEMRKVVLRWVTLV
jgi:hypothetical protein